MKKSALQLIIIICFSLTPFITEAQKKINLTFKFVTTNTKEGYDHISKLIINCDDEKIGESLQKSQSKPSTVTVKIPSGKHKITATLYALYEGKWEPRTIANEYSFDFEYHKTGNWEVNNTINLTFDIETEMVIITEKIPIISAEEDINVETEKAVPDSL